ncbi:MAG: hypothetical protein H6660_12145 [Ardenticatenaceae bacterium]|nr:hypothetical protein [Ardenticatenaceae bacterium]
MKKIQLILLLTILVTLLVPGHGAPTVAAQGTNLLQNPSFEGPYDDKGAASSWARWHRESSADQFGDCTNGYHKKPRWGQATDFVYDGGSSQYVGNNWDTWSGGMWQNVTVTPGSTYRFLILGTRLWLNGQCRSLLYGPEYGYSCRDRPQWQRLME